MPTFFFPKKYFFYLILGTVWLAGVTYVAQEISNAAELSPRSRYEQSRLDKANRKITQQKQPEVNLQTDTHRSQRWERIRNYYLFWRWISRAFPYLIALTFSAVYEVTKMANQQEQRTVELKKEKLETELKFLQSQTNPHFLFNALNNIYALSVLNSSQTPENLLKLSDMLRYMLYEADATDVPIQKEIDYLKNYIDLQQLKDSKGLNVVAQWEKEDLNWQIAPLLLIPFVENAFKHSKIEDREKGWIQIHLSIEQGQLHFQVVNSLFKNNVSKAPTGGIGLQNVMRRLDLLYPNRYQLNIQPENDRFWVDLKIDLR